MGNKEILIKQIVPAVQIYLGLILSTLGYGIIFKSIISIALIVIMIGLFI
jgi:hypothetical protein